MVNLKEETLDVLESHGKTINDIKFVNFEGTTARNPLEILNTLMDVEYDDGYGTPEVNMGLEIVGDSWWLERHEYDGSEWWEFKELPTETEETVKVTSVLEDPWGD